jgi:PAS domain S-box-containing protein
MSTNRNILELFGEVLEDSLNEIYVFNADTFYFNVVNRGARNNLGYTMAELSKMTPLDLKPRFTKDSFAALIGPLRSGVLQESVFTTQHRRKDGSMYPVEVHLRMSTQGTPAFVAIILDITERKRAEDALRAADRLSAMGTMIAGVAHEINTPLTVISGLSEMIAKDATLGAVTRQYADEVVEQSSRVARIIEDLLGLARVGQIAKSAVQINKVVQRALGHLRNSSRFNGVKFVEDYDESIPETLADRFRMEQVFVNIIRNAGDALSEVNRLRQLVIRTTWRSEQISVSITDTGVGIEDPTKVFDPFFTTKAIGDGIGLGLSVSLGIVRDHRGDITVTRVDEGTQFLVTLPVHMSPTD